MSSRVNSVNFRLGVTKLWAQITKKNYTLKKLKINLYFSSFIYWYFQYRYGLILYNYYLIKNKFQWLLYVVSFRGLSYFFTRYNEIRTKYPFLKRKKRIFSRRRRPYSRYTNFFFHKYFGYYDRGHLEFILNLKSLWKWFNNNTLSYRTKKSIFKLKLLKKKIKFLFNVLYNKQLSKIVLKRKLNRKKFYKNLIRYFIRKKKLYFSSILRINNYKKSIKKKNIFFFLYKKFYIKYSTRKYVWKGRRGWQIFGKLKRRFVIKRTPKFISQKRIRRCNKKLYFLKKFKFRFKKKRILNYDYKINTKKIYKKLLGKHRRSKRFSRLIKLFSKKLIKNKGINPKIKKHIIYRKNGYLKFNKKLFFLKKKVLPKYKYYWRRKNKRWFISKKKKFTKKRKINKKKLIQRKKIFRINYKNSDNLPIIKKYLGKVKKLMPSAFIKTKWFQTKLLISKNGLKKKKRLLFTVLKRINNQSLFFFLFLILNFIKKRKKLKNNKRRINCKGKTIKNIIVLNYYKLYLKYRYKRKYQYRLFQKKLFLNKKKWVLYKYLNLILSTRLSLIFNTTISCICLSAFSIINEYWKIFYVKVSEWLLNHANIKKLRGQSYLVQRLAFIFLISMKFKNFTLFMRYISLLFFRNRLRKRQWTVMYLYRKLLKEGFFNLKYIKGIQFYFRGKMNKKPRARRIVFFRGQKPALQNLKLYVHYSSRHLTTNFGAYTFRLWVYYENTISV